MTKVQQLREQVERGTYTVPSAAIAEAIINDTFMLYTDDQVRDVLGVRCRGGGG